LTPRPLISRQLEGALVLDAIAQTVTDITKRIDDVLDVLGDREPSASLFFLELQRALAGAREEEDLINVFIAMSTTAFQGFQFPPDSLAPIDALLADAERIAFTFTASGDAH
jgi:hypothetical protein